jgi:DNA-binding transcriptional regulator GbsR (MarR family)
VNTLREAFQKRIQHELDQKQKQVEERQQRYQNDLDRRLHPKTKDDFDVLYAALESKYSLKKFEKRFVLYS